MRTKKHPSYLCFDGLDEYEERCRKDDPTGFDLVFVYEDGIEKIVEIDEYLKSLQKQDKEKVEMDINIPLTDSEDEDELDKQKDPARKFQFQYDRSVCMADKFPEAAIVEDTSCMSFAPGEGKIPENILMTDNWDIDAFPMKYPDGKNGLHQKRERKLTDQYHFVQRLRNKDTRFSSDPSYVFAAAQYLEKQKLQRNINVSFQRGKKSTSETGENSYTLDDGFSVFDKVSNTPAYWKVAKYEMYAKLDNLGPFQFFFTLSSADCRWDENFTSILRDMNVDIEYNFQANGEEETIVRLKDGTTCPLKQYLDENVDQSRHELIRTHVVNASRIYNHRVKAFINEIIMDKSNPMAVKYYSTKVEFQGRGAGHNHGTLWVDLKKMEYNVEIEERKWLGLDDLLAEWDIELQSNTKSLSNDIKHFLQELVSDKNKQEADIDEELQENFRRLLSLEDGFPVTPSFLLSKFPLLGISSAFKKFQDSEELLEHEEKAVIRFADKFTTCTLNQATLAAMTEDEELKETSGKLVEILKSVNIHAHTQTCRKYLTTCRFNFAKFPVWKTLVSRPFKSIPSDLKKEYKGILNKVKSIIDDKEMIEKILSEYPDRELETREEYERNREVRIKKVLNVAGLKTQDDYDKYISALEGTTTGYSVILQRDISELYVNSYNPEWARAWNGNHDIQICLDFFAVITYITEYYTKSDSGTMKILLEALKNSNCEDLKQRMKLLMNTYISARQMGETEALYKIFPDFYLKDSNIATINVPVNKKENRSKFLIKIDEETSYNGQEKLKITGRDGMYVEKYDIISKFERKEDGDDDLSYSQFAKMYEPCWKNKENDKGFNENCSDSDDENLRSVAMENHFPESTKFDFTMRCRNDPSDPDHQLCCQIRGKKLRNFIKLKNPYPGEPPFMRKRKSPAVLRFHKFKSDKNPQEYFFAEALLYKPFSSEEKLEQDIKNLTASELDSHVSQIQCVKSQVMEYLDNVTEARYFAEELQRNEEMGQGLDPQGEQEKEDCEYEGIVDHPDYPDLNIEELEDEIRKKNLENNYRAMEVDDMCILLEKSKALDYYQRKVMEIGIRYARGIVKSMKHSNPIPDAPKIMVHGGAGAGKSCVINIVKQWVHLILQTSGDNPDCPYILVTAPTGTAAANVRGMTLHSAFGFTFGNEHYSLSDKKRDEMRTRLKYLRFVIIDEISMVKADLLYQLDMRLKEITQKPDKIFGGVGIFAFGDLLQLQPIQARYIFQEPICKDYKLGFYSGLYWQSFEAITLEENHRQGNDRSYAELLNRVRIGRQTDEDIKQLETRVRPMKHQDLEGVMYINCTNVEVNRLNETGLNALDSQLIVNEAVNFHTTIKNFKPPINSRGNIGTERNETPFRQTLHMKIGAKVMLTYNIDVNDCLTNGSRGQIVAFDINKTGLLEKVIIKFDDDHQGRRRQESDKALQKKYPGCTAIEKILYQYSLGRKKSSVSNSAKVIQFPLRLCFATTSHKFQGQTVVKPNKLAIDLRSVFKPAMGYVMLSRVQEINQLFIIGGVPANKLHADNQAIEELERLDKISLNKNPSRWEENVSAGINILALNCQSLRSKMEHIRHDPVVKQSDVICLNETWLNSDDTSAEIHAENYEVVLNSAGFGKGLATFIKDKQFHHSANVKDENYQITMISSDVADIISVYRSKEGNTRMLLKDLSKVLDPEKVTVICGDVNICFKMDRQNTLVRSLEEQGFTQYVTEATHLRGGLIDHAYIRRGVHDIDINVSIYSPYYCARDHDAILISLRFKNQVLI